jgi:hypothetical protein
MGRIVLRALWAEPRATPQTEPLLDGAVFIAILLRRPDERPDDDHQHEDAGGGDHDPEERAHAVSLRPLVPGNAGRAYAVCIAGLARIRQLFRRKPLTDDELRRRQEAALARDRLGAAKLVDRRGTINEDELRRR